MLNRTTRCAALMLGAFTAVAQAGAPMTFFVTSVGNGANGGNYGGLAGADARCQSLAAAVGAGGRTWRAYLGTAPIEGSPGTLAHARDRIGPGPWHNVNGVLIASDVASLHAPGFNPPYEQMRTETGQLVPADPMGVNDHDILTAVFPDGTAMTEFPGNPSAPPPNCRNWTSSSPDDFAYVGHVDASNVDGQLWNSRHEVFGCDQAGLQSTAGSGRLYCFALAAAPTPAVNITPTTGLMTSESGLDASFSVVLATQPTATVFVDFTGDVTEGSLTPSSVSFSTSTWNTPRTITVNGVDDALADGSVSYMVTGTATSTDLSYDGIAVPSVGVVNIDDENAGITVAPTSGLVTSEGSGQDTFNVVLNTQPAANVTIGVSSNDVTEGQPSTAQLVFTPMNWNTMQPVTVTGQEDALADGDVVYTIVTAASVSNDPAYNGIDPADVEVTNVDNESNDLIFLDGFEN